MVVCCILLLQRHYWVPVWTKRWWHKCIYEMYNKCKQKLCLESSNQTSYCTGQVWFVKFMIKVDNWDCYLFWPNFGADRHIPALSVYLVTSFLCLHRVIWLEKNGCSSSGWNGYWHVFLKQWFLASLVEIMWFFVFFLPHLFFKEKPE